ncbi:MAG: heme-binding protein, partial [Planctomycetota bacterium]
RYHCGNSVVETSLPAGYPAPTPPGAIDLKRYPAVRRAEVSGRSPAHRGRNGAFFSLFRHIQRRDIAMTAPVEMDYPGWSVDASARPEAWTMAFLYRTPDAGPVEQSGDVRVVDTMPLTVVSVGLRGKYGRATEDRGFQRLSAWLDSQDEWEQAGDPRVLSYNGPSIRDSRKWSEVQIPVRRAGATIPSAESEAGSGASRAGEEAGGILPATFLDGRGGRRSASDAKPRAE